jgi:UDP-N-acetylmuramate dehydrogenase
MLIRENVPLAPLTTLGVGGPARYFAEAKTEAEMLEAVEFASSRSLPLFVLGGGSNVVVADAGFAGLVLKIGVAGLSQFEVAPDKVIFVTGAGLDWDSLVEQTVNAKCAGLECLSGIPGSVGATPVQNVGAYGQEVSQTIEQVRALELQSLRVVTLNNQECGFGYRSSIYNTSERGRYIILSVTFTLRRGGNSTLQYPDLQNFFKDRSLAPSLAEVRDAVREIRHRKAMLIVPGEDDARSVGSFFKNPVVPQTTADELSARAASRGLQLPSYSATDGFRKIPAAWLVEQAGLDKGYSRARAGISRKHALAIVNRGGATAAEIIALKDQIQKRVFAEFGILLETEPVFVGF